MSLRFSGASGRTCQQVISKIQACIQTCTRAFTESVCERVTFQSLYLSSDIDAINAEDKKKFEDAAKKLSEQYKARFVSPPHS